jgi:hypothetical protein
MDPAKLAKLQAAAAANRLGEPTFAGKETEEQHLIFMLAFDFFLLYLGMGLS